MSIGSHCKSLTYRLKYLYCLILLLFVYAASYQSLFFLIYAVWGVSFSLKHLLHHNWVALDLCFLCQHFSCSKQIFFFSSTTLPPFTGPPPPNSGRQHHRSVISTAFHSIDFRKAKHIS